MSRVEDAEGCKERGNEYLKKKEYDSAIAEYTQALQFHQSHVYYSNRSAAYLSKDYATSALKDAEEAIRLKPDWPKGYSRKGAALHSLHRYDEAIQAYEEGLKVDPGNEALQIGLDSVKQAKQNPYGFSSSSAGGDAGGLGSAMGSLFGPDMFEKIKANPKTAPYMSDPSFVQAMTKLQQDPNALQSQMNDPRVMETLGVLLGVDFSSGDVPGEGGAEGEHGRTGHADQQQHKSAQAPPKEETPEEKEEREKREKADAYKAEGNKLYKQKEFEQAIEQYNKALEVFPTEITYMLNIASVKLEMGDLDGCIKQCEEALQVGREHNAPYEKLAKAYERMGNAYLKFNQTDKALEMYNSANVEQRTASVDAKIRKIEKQKKEEQEKEYIDPQKAAEAKERGNEKFKQGDFPSAVEEYTEAIRRDPSNAVYYSNRSAAYTKLTDYGRAKEDCDKALKLDPSFVRAYNRRGKIETFVKEYHKALTSFRKALELEPENAEAKEGLSRVQGLINAGEESEEDRKARAARAMEDPEIRNIMNDPVMNQVLSDMSTDPSAARKHMSDPSVAANLEKLIAAGIVQTR